MTKIFNDALSYKDADLANKHKSTAGTQELISSERIEAYLRELYKEGFIIIEDLIPKERILEIKEDVLPRLGRLLGRNNIEGLATQRLYSVMEKTFACNELVEHPLVLGLLDRLLEPNYLLSQLQVINILPGEAAQPLHYDDGFYRVPRPREPLGAATIFALDDFTENNGATVVLPKSHTWPDRTPEESEEQSAKKAVMPAGSMLFFLGTLWHGGGQNSSNASRMCVTAQYCAPWCRQQENFSLSVSRERAKQCSEHVKRMLGYSIHPPFMGFVNGMHPKRLLDNG
jgi:hypothetical protein